MATLSEAIMGVTVGRYHLYTRTRPSGTFYYYWYEENSRRVSKSCGHACNNKRTAVAYLETLLKQDLAETKKQNDLMKITLGEYAKDMFIDGAPHLIRWAAKGRVLKRQTIA